MLENSVFYEIYPLGFCGGLHNNSHNIKEVLKYIEHYKKLNVNVIYFAPIFQSDNHGYDTQDYFKIDERLGTNEDFKEVVEVLHANGIKVIIDGVFNHVGRGFWAFKDVLAKRWDSQYKDWFHIDFNGNSNYDDHLWYEGWEGYYDLVKLNLYNPEVVNHIVSAVSYWKDYFNIDGLRLDVAYSLNHDFIRTLRNHVNQYQDFILVGEMLHGDYNQLVNDQMLHSCTNYECYKGLYSSMNERNLFEIGYSLNRQFGKEQWTLYKGKHLLNFVDNHDVTRIASILKNKDHLPLIYALLFAMPGMPCIYYGSEWGIEAEKQKGSDNNLRPEINEVIYNNLSEQISIMANIHQHEKALVYGSYEQVLINNEYLVFKREYENETVYFALNIKDSDVNVHIGNGGAINLVTNEEINLDNVTLGANSYLYLKAK